MPMQLKKNAVYVMTVPNFLFITGSVWMSIGFFVSGHAPVQTALRAQQMYKSWLVARFGTHDVTKEQAAQMRKEVNEVVKASKSSRFWRWFKFSCTSWTLIPGVNALFWPVMAYCLRNLRYSKIERQRITKFLKSKRLDNKNAKDVTIKLH